MNVSYIKNLKTPIAVVGLGKSGLAAVDVLRHVGFSNDEIILFDEKDSTATCRNFSDLLALKPQTLVVSPGVPLKTPAIRDLVSQGAELTSEINLAASLLENEKLIGVTGSVGKSTITSLIGVGLKSFDPNAFVGGNLGVAFCHYALGLLQGKPRAQWIALELSSYQLENCSRLNLLASVISFLSPNHLERYTSLDEYYRTKIHITQLTRELCFVNSTSLDAVKYSKQAHCPVKLVNANTFVPQEMLGKIFLIGKHNRDNFSLAASIAQYFLWPESSFKAMCNYKGLSHRLEFIAQVKGVTYINDSKATAMDSVLVAAEACLENLEHGHKVFLLLGGKDKNLPWNELSTLSQHGEKFNFVFFGQCGELAQAKSGLSGPYFEKLGSAVQYAQLRSHNGDVVLLSPGGTSLDEFRNFEERGDFFKTLVLT